MMLYHNILDIYFSNLINGNEEQSQIEKEKLEVRQREDRKLVKLVEFINE